MASPPNGAVSKRLPPSCYWEFPESWEERLSVVDDRMTQLLQRFQSPSLRVMHLLLSFVNGIELGIIVSYAFLYVGLNNMATLVTTMMASLTFVSQFFKRFFWRDRPFMNGRAKQFTKGDTTSSFPSRSVTCSVVYVYIVSGCVELAASEGKDNLASFNLFWQWPFVLLALLNAINVSFVKIYVGAHYASDCLGGLFQALIVCYVGETFYYITANECCMTALLSAKEMAEGTLKLADISWIALICWTVVGAVLIAMMTSQKIQYWKKSHYLFGVLYPCLVSLFMFLCCQEKMPLVSYLDIHFTSMCIAIFIPTILMIGGRFLLPDSTVVNSTASFLFLHTLSVAALLFHRAVS